MPRLRIKICGAKSVVPTGVWTLSIGASGIEYRRVATT